MKCQSCGEREATIHYIEIVEGRKTSQWICSECAEKEGVFVKEVTSLEHGALENFLGGLLDQTALGDEEVTVTEPAECPECGCRFNDLHTKGKLGCPKCYAVFREQLIPFLHRFHGEIQHIGKLPASGEPQAAIRRELASIKQRLDAAIKCEDYEEAARQRDLARERKRELERLAKGPRAAVSDEATEESHDEPTGE